jgi:hypothetical protein
MLAVFVIEYWSTICGTLHISFERKAELKGSLLTAITS